MRALAATEVLSCCRQVSWRTNILAPPANFQHNKRNAGEDKLNDLLADLLSNRVHKLSWTVHREARSGFSGTAAGGGCNVGEADIVVRKDTWRPLLVESMILNCVASKSIRGHFDRALRRYPQLDVPIVFLVTWCYAKNFRPFCGRYESKVKEVSNEFDQAHRIRFEGIAPIEEITHPETAAGMHVFVSKHTFSQQCLAYLPCVHVIVDMLQDPRRN